MGLIVLLCLGVLAAVGSAESSSLEVDGQNRALVSAGGCSAQTSTVTLNPGDYSVFTSPNYPDNFGAFNRCIWRFQTSGSSSLRLQCPEVFLALFAHILVTDGIWPRWYKCLSCGSALQIDQTFSAQSVSIDFSNGFLFANKGFSCTITATAPGQTCKCGTSDVRRIVGGTNAQSGEFPWMAGVVNRGENLSFCGGTLINSQYVLTAAHCTQNPGSLSLDVRLGVLNESSSPSTEVRRQVLQIINHPNYNTTTFDNDFALLRIADVNFANTPSVRPICLPLSGSNNLDGKNVVVAGWGALSAGGQFPQNLLKVTLPVVTNDACRAQLGPTVTITGNMFCAGGAEGKDSCQGDSGGPAMLRVGAFYELAGVVSFGQGCGARDTPGVYAKVAALLPWIQQNSNSGSTCPRP